ncbi:MAG TPA: hypothetical protein VIJ75_00460 [Hanamia sp.]
MRYVKQVSRAFVNLFTTKAKAQGKSCKKGIKIASGSSEIAGDFGNFFLKIDQKPNNIMYGEGIRVTYKDIVG